MMPTSSPVLPSMVVIGRRYGNFGRIFEYRYTALYDYKPKNLDELELKEGDVVCVMEKCDDGWFVGFSETTSEFGTFPGNYVERLF